MRIAVLFACLTLATLARAEQVEEIIVKGELRESPQDSLPESVSVLSADDVEREHAQHLENVLALAPNLNYASGASRGRYFQIRGIGEDGQFIQPLNASVGLIVDHVDLSGVGAVATLYDVEQVEIFRGPQGTLYGANALAGLINVTTRAPTDTPEAGVDLGGGSYGTYSAGGYLSGPLTDTLGGRIAVHQFTSDGYVHNDFLKRDNTNDFDELTTRAKLTWTPTESLSFDAMGGYVDVDNGYDAFSLNNKRDTISDQPGNDKQETWLGSLHAAYTGAQAVRFDATYARADSQIVYGYDEDWTYVGFDPNGYSSTDLYKRDHTTTTAELRASSSDAGRIFGDSTDWVAGVYRLWQQEGLHRIYPILDLDFRGRFEIDRVALFGQTDTHFGEATTLSIGARFERHESNYRDNNGVGFDPRDELWGGRIALDHLVGANTLIYVSASRGYKAGGFNTDGTLPPDLRTYDPETLYNVEVGVKGSWCDDAITGRAALFYMWRKDMQVATSIQVQNPGGSTQFIEFTGNAAEGDNAGFEGELRWKALSRLDVFASLGLLHTDYNDFVNAVGVRLDGRDQAQAPEYTAHGGFELGFGRGAYFRAEVDAKDRYYYSPDNDTRSKSYALVDLTAGVERDAWSASAWVRNLGDIGYHVQGYYFGNDPRIDYAPKSYTQLGDPRLFGVTVSWRLL